MSRVMELVTTDSREVAAQRAYEAMLRIGKVLEYKEESYVEGKVYTDGYPALITVEWHPHRDGERIRLDISATSNDELSRAADSALYRFMGAFKQITAEELAELPRRRARQRTVAAAGLLLLATVTATVAYLIGIPRF